MPKPTMPTSARIESLDFFALGKADCTAALPNRPSGRAPPAPASRRGARRRRAPRRADRANFFADSKFRISNTPGARLGGPAGAKRAAPPGRSTAYRRSGAGPARAESAADGEAPLAGCCGRSSVLSRQVDCGRIALVHFPCESVPKHNSRPWSAAVLRLFIASKQTGSLRERSQHNSIKAERLAAARQRPRRRAASPPQPPWPQPLLQLYGSRCCGRPAAEAQTLGRCGGQGSDMGAGPGALPGGTRPRGHGTGSRPRVHRRGWTRGVG